MRHIGRHIWKTLLGVVCVGGLCAACTARQEICITGSVRNADGELLVCRHSVGGMFNSQTGDTLELQPDSTFTLTLPGGEYERVEFYLLRKKKMGSLLLKGGNVQVILDGRAEKPMIVEGLEEKTMRVAELLDSLYDDVFDIRVREGDRWGIARDTVAASVRRKLTDYALSLDKEVAGVDKELLDKPADAILMNGFEDDFVPKGAAYAGKRKRARALKLRIANCLLGQEFGDDVLLVATSGRYEFKNKGIDVFLEALNRLNRDKNLKKQVLAFVNVPGWVGDPREDLQKRLKSKEKFTTPLPCPLITHWLHDMTHDQVLDMLKYLDLNNRPEDKVKVIFVPCYLDGRDGIVNKTYYDMVPGLDLSVYPSYYEPWGYTPLESVAFRVPTITTDLAGFGLWVNSLRNQHGIEDGVQVLHRSDYNYSEVADGVKDTISLFSTKSADEVKAIRKRAGQVAEQALWKHFIQYYYEAYDIALRHASKRLLG